MADLMSETQAVIKLYEMGAIDKQKVIAELGKQHANGELNERQSMLFQELISRNGGIPQNEEA